MFLYAMQPHRGVDTNCADNTILLRRDLHKIWDDHRFAVVPKQGRWVVHVLDNHATNELHERYHNLEMQPLTGVARQFLLCRYALAIICRSVFLDQGFSRNLVMVEGGRTVAKSLSGDQCRALFSPPSRAGSRSQSPKKRQRNGQDQEEQDEDDNDDGTTAEQRDAELKDAWSCQRTPESQSWSGSESESNGSRFEDAEPPRGRTRKRGRSPSVLDCAKVEPTAEKDTSRLQKRRRSNASVTNG